MSSNVSRRRRPKKAPPVPSVHWRHWCPVCVKPGVVIAGCWHKGGGGRGLHYWACEECAVKLISYRVGPEFGGPG